ncbi:TetR family transcriptional regulator [Actibacterium atlanticum]|uniref:TetR family transcriptional regulator n=1 Tax=Actibacterium atlanticum TaxID=1461693 RepID=A0A058ZLK2_9RHOB|nr:TetR/AcrR family transcriptional regulator [Actibacterium atlanticum]KCV82077.1 TetR family transcriptional regulator [Actibacterium atlanticum]
MPSDTDRCAQPQRRSIGARRNPETEAAILTAAQELVEEKGLRGLTMEAVAKRARAGKATLYKWWPSRGALLVALYHASKGEHRHTDLGSLPETIAGFYSYVFGFWQTPAGRLFPLIIAEAQSNEDVADALQDYRQERLADLTALVSRAQARGELVADTDSEALADLIMANAWMHLMTGRIAVTDPAKLAHDVLRGWCLPDGSSA